MILQGLKYFCDPRAQETASIQGKTSRSSLQPIWLRWAKERNLVHLQTATEFPGLQVAIKLDLRGMPPLVSSRKDINLVLLIDEYETPLMECLSRVLQILWCGQEISFKHHANQVSTQGLQNELWPG